MRFKQIFFCFTAIIVFSFLTNFLWESLHGYSLYADHVIDSDKYVKMMLYMSLMDAMTILLMYMVCAFITRDILWLEQLDPKKVIFFIGLGLFVAFAVEYWSVYVTHEWHYNENMPVIFGIGLSPLVQLSVTGLSTIWLVNKLI